MNISCNTDYNGGTGEFSSRLQWLGEAGFTHIMWCHQWNTDFLYTKSEIDQIREDLKSSGLKLLDIHGSSGSEKCWFSPVEYERKAGVELVRNRLEMFDALEGEGVVMMHTPHFKFNTATNTDPNPRELTQKRFEALQKSLDELLPVAEKYHTKIASENLIRDDWELLEKQLALYPAKVFGLCYDCGHGWIHTDRMPLLDKYKDRLIATHLQDNDGTGDHHCPPFYKTLDWEKLSGIIAASGYQGPAAFEISIRNTPFFNPELPVQSAESCRAFLADAYIRCGKVAKMIEDKRKALKK